jgi:predicted  nucleic acid-binding Zn-ribbon protein
MNQIFDNGVKMVTNSPRSGCSQCGNTMFVYAQHNAFKECMSCKTKQ